MRRPVNAGWIRVGVGLALPNTANYPPPSTVHSSGLYLFPPFLTTHMLWCLKPHKAVRAGWDQASSARGSSLGLGRYPGIPPGGALLTGIRFDGHGPPPPLSCACSLRSCRVDLAAVARVLSSTPAPVRCALCARLASAPSPQGALRFGGQTEVTTQTGLSSWVTRRGQRALKQEHPPPHQLHRKSCVPELACFLPTAHCAQRKLHHFQARKSALAGHLPGCSASDLCLFTSHRGCCPAGLVYDDGWMGDWHRN